MPLSYHNGVHPLLIDVNLQFLQAAGSLHTYIHTYIHTCNVCHVAGAKRLGHPMPCFATPGLFPGLEAAVIKHAKATSTHHHAQQLWNRQHGAHAQGHRPMIVTVGCNFGGMFCILLLLYAGSRSDNAFLVTLHRRVSTKWCRCRKVEEDTCRLDSCWFGIQVVLLLWRFRGTFVDVAIYAVGHWVAPEIFLWRCRQVHSCWMPCMRRALAARGRRLNMRLKVCRFAVSCASPEYILHLWHMLPEQEDLEIWSSPVI